MSSIWALIASLGRINHLDMKNMLCFRCSASYLQIQHFRSLIYKEEMGRFAHFLVAWRVLWIEIELVSFSAALPKGSILQCLCNHIVICFVLHFSCFTNFYCGNIRFISVSILISIGRYFENVTRANSIPEKSLVSCLSKLTQAQKIPTN